MDKSITSYAPLKENADGTFDVVPLNENPTQAQPADPDTDRPAIKPTFYTHIVSNCGPGSNMDYIAKHGLYSEEVWITYEDAKPQYDQITGRLILSVVNRKATDLDVVKFATEYNAFRGARNKAKADLERNLKYLAEHTKTRAQIEDEFKESHNFKKLPVLDIG